MQSCFNDGTKSDIKDFFYDETSDSSDSAKNILKKKLNSLKKLQKELQSDQVHHILIGKKGKLEALPKRWRKENYK